VTGQLRASKLEVMEGRRRGSEEGRRERRSTNGDDDGTVLEDGVGRDGEVLLERAIREATKEGKGAEVTNEGDISSRTGNAELRLSSLLRLHERKR